MKKLVLILAVGIVLTSCTEVIFEEPQPLGVKQLKSIPSELQGSFSFVIMNEETLMEIGSNYITGDDDRSYLSDSLIIKKMGNQFIVNKRIDDAGEKEGMWEVYVLEDKGCGFVKATSFIINSDTYVSKFEASTGGTVIGEGQEKSMIIKPTADQFNSILKDDSVTVSIILERVK